MGVFFHLRYDFLVVKPALILLPKNDVGRRLVEPDPESVELLLDDLLVRHALSGGSTARKEIATDETNEKNGPENASTF